MQWQEVCENKHLQDLPFQIELNKWGQIVISPAKPKHSAYQGIMITLLSELMETGLAFPACTIQTTDGVKIADVVWCSDRIADIIL